MAQGKHPPIYSLTLVVCFALSGLAFGQEQFPPDYPAGPNVRRQPVVPSPANPPVTPPQSQAHTQPQAPGSPGPQTPTTPAQPPAPTTPPSLLDHPAQPAKVSLASGKLSVQADNSSLSDILHQISTSSGMKVQGLRSSGADQRVFGTYGPGTPRDVLSDLLDGAGYNVLMLGVTPSGTPRELSLSAKPTGGKPGAQPQAPSTDQNNDSEDDVQTTQYQDEQQNVTPPPGPPAEMRRTPQQMLEELQRMRQQQQQQQPQQESPPPQ